MHTEPRLSDLNLLCC